MRIANSYQRHLKSLKRAFVPSSLDRAVEYCFCNYRFARYLFPWYIRGGCDKLCLEEKRFNELSSLYRVLFLMDLSHPEEIRTDYLRDFAAKHCINFEEVAKKIEELIREKRDYDEHEKYIKSPEHRKLNAKWSALGATNISGFQGDLSLSFKDISDVALKELETVTSPLSLSLHYSSTKFSDSNLESLAHLEHLWLTVYGSQVSDISTLKSLTSLKVLLIFYSQVKDLSPLKCLTNLETVGLHYASVSNLSPLKDLENLERISLYGTLVNADEIQKLQTAMPDCNIN